LPFLIVGLILNVAFPSPFDVGGPSEALRTVSIVVLTAGVTIWVWSIVLILTKVPRGELITSGPCSLVKHPLYTGVALLVLPWIGFLLNSYGMALRILISGRPPVTNMYETIVFVAWGGMLFALVFEAIYRVRYFATCAGAVSTIALIIADNVPIFDGAISPLVPVLRDNMWLTVHVLTIMLGYAAFTLAMGIGHMNLGLYFFRPAKAVLFKNLSLFLYRALQVGTLFLAVGTLLGGVWASYSWGRFWGWDPKETWALIATLGYLAILHARMTGWIKDFGMAVGSLLGYLLVLMAWYGVNFVLGTGLHSYGFGSGGYWYVGGFVAFEVGVITAALLRRRSEMQKHIHASAPAPAPAH